MRLVGVLGGSAAAALVYRGCMRASVATSKAVFALTVLAIMPALAALTACSSSDDGGAEPAPPAPPPPGTVVCQPGEADEGGACVPAGIVACPDGMSGSDGLCAPTFPATCKPGTAKLLGDAACVAIGHATCPAGTAVDASGWGCAATIAASCTGGTRATPDGACMPVGTCPSALPAGAVRFVDDGFTAGQIDATHFATIGAALTSAPAGTVVSVAAGTYHENVVVPAGVAIIGACAGDIVIEPAVDATGPALRAASGMVTLRGLTLRGGGPVGLTVDGATVDADAIVIEQSRGFGIVVQSGALALKSSVIRNTLKLAVKDGGVGLFAGGGTTTLDDVTIDGSAGTGMSVWRTSVVVAHGLNVVRTSSDAAGHYGWGIDVESGGSFDGTRVVVSGASFAGIAVTDMNSHLVLADAIVTDVALGTAPAGGPKLGAGIAVTAQATVDIHDVSLGKTAGSSILAGGAASLTAKGVTARDGGGATDAIGGVFASAAKITLASSAIVGAVHNGIQSVDGATITVDGVLVSDTKTNADTSSGIGALTATKGRLEGKRLTLERNATAQLAAIDESFMVLESVATLDARGGTTDTFTGTGIGLIADKASKVTLTRAYLGQNKLLGVSLRRGASLEATGLVVDGVDLVASGAGGYGVLALEGSSATLSDFSVRGAHGVSLLIGEAGTKATLARGTLRDVALDTNPGVARGVSVQAGAVATLDRVRMTNMTATAVYISKASTASLVSCVVDGVVPDPNGKFGDAIEVVERSVLRLDKTVIRNAKGAALVFAGGTGAITASLIEKNAVGIHAQDGSVLSEADEVPADLADQSVVVARSTRFEDNATKVGQGVLPLPQPLPFE
jgi:hypothetical protein